MIVWIDSAAHAEAQSLFGLSPLERIARSLRRLHRKPRRVIVSGPDAPAQVPQGFEVVRDGGSAGARLRDALATAGDSPVLVLDIASVTDPRLIRHLAENDAEMAAPRTAVHDDPDGGRAGVVRLTARHADSVPAEAPDIAAVADAVSRSLPEAVVQPEAVPSFVVNLRRHLPFYLLPVRDAAAAKRAERRMFGWNYKGSTDFMTKWVYPPLVWRLVKLSTAAGLSANAITIVSIALTFAAVPLFATGAFAAGLLCAFGMSVLDSVDGKVARLTLSDSPIGNILDHGLDIVHPPLWYAAWAMGLGAQSWGDPLALVGGLLIAFYVADRLVLMVAKARFRRGLHAMTPLDGAVRTWIARRNVNLVIFAVGLVIGQGVAAFTLICAWQGLTMAWHAVRTAWLIASGARPAEAS